MSRARDERRAQHKRYKEDVEERGKAFFPYVMFHDTVMSLVVVSVTVGLACVWYLTADEGTEPEGPSGSGWLGVLYEGKADPGTTSFIPRPDWYFYFLFYLLRIFKWPDTVVLGTVGVPTIALMLLLALPFIDTRRERRLFRRPVALVAAILTVVSMGVLTYKGATAEEGTGAASAVTRWIEENNIPEGEARTGAELFAESGCTNCHTYGGTGTALPGAPDLTTVGQRLDKARLQAYIANPRQFGNNVMPVYGTSLTDEQLSAIATFLEASKGQ